MKRKFDITCYLILSAYHRVKTLIRLKIKKKTFKTFQLHRYAGHRETVNSAYRPIPSVSGAHRRTTQLPPFSGAQPSGGYTLLRCKNTYLEF